MVLEILKESKYQFYKKNPPLNIRLIRRICSEMNCEDAAIIFCIEIRLLSHGVVLKVLFELRCEV